jgi:hypothetical protein
MDFYELAGFIEDSLERLYDPDPGGDRPHSPEEFRLVWKLLREQRDASPDPPPPRDPLEAAYRKRTRTKKYLKVGGPKAKKRRKQVLQALDRLNREIEEMEASGNYRRPPVPASRSPRENRSRIVSKIFEDIDRAFKRQPTGRFQWQPLPPVEATPRKVHRHYRERLQHEGRLDKFDQARLDTATALPYEEWWVPTEGFGGFDAYSIISFAHTKKVLLECPIYGNAAFVINAAEEVWREMTKQELTDSGLAERIPHRGENWPAKVKHALDLE